MEMIEKILIIKMFFSLLQLIYIVHLHKNDVKSLEILHIPWIKCKAKCGFYRIRLWSHGRG